MPTDRATARARIAERALTAAAAERVVRVALGDLPVSLVGRATAQLRRFFSGGSWTAEDDAALAAAVGPGTGWYEEQLDPELTLGFGWRAGAFRAEVRFTPAETAPPTDSPAAVDLGIPGRPGADRGSAGVPAPVATAARARTLGDTFEDVVVLEFGRAPTELCFRVGPGAGPNALFTRDTASRDARIEAVFDACPTLEQIAVASGTLTATIDDATHWPDDLLEVFDAITAEFAPARAVPADRQLERARSELGRLQVDNARDLARILDATTSPDAAFRRIAMERLDGADAAVGVRPWTRGLEDSSRAVRRVTARVLASSARPETRDLLERALADTDACVRYFAVRGLVAIGLGPSEAALQHRRADTDVRVRLATDAALDGRVPA